MRYIPDFKIEHWVNNHGADVPIQVHGSNVKALSLNELQNLSKGRDHGPLNFDLTLSYGSAQGSVALRERLAELHSSEDVKLTAENVVITPGSIMANYLALTNLASSGDHIICQYPTFAQLFAIPRALGAEVSLWRAKREDNWVPQISELASLIKPNTKAIIINNPTNPTGVVFSDSALRELVALAEKHNITLYSDEVFRPLFHTSDPAPSALVSLGYKNSLSTGSLSKAHGLPGIRLGWVISPNLDLIERVMNVRGYTTISVSRLDDDVALYALSPEVLPQLIERNLALCRSSLGLLRGFVERHAGRVEWIPPRGAGTAWLRILDAHGDPVDDQKFALGIGKKGGVSLLPGEVFADAADGEFKGYFRFALGDDAVLKQALEVLETFL